VGLNTLIRRMPLSIRFFAGTLAVVIAGIVLLSGLTVIGYEQSQTLRDKFGRDFQFLQSLSDASARLARTHIDIQRLLEEAGQSYDEEAVYTRGSAAFDAIDGVIADLQKTMYTEAALLLHSPNEAGYRAAGDILELVHDYRATLISSVEMTSVDLKLARRELVRASDAFNRTAAQVTDLIGYFQGDLDRKFQDSIAAARRVLLWWGIPGGLIVGAVLFGSWLMTMGLSRDLGQILGCMRALGAGDTDAAIPDLRGDRELAPIGEALGVFRSALVDLTRHQAVLKDKVRERTSELEKTLADLKTEMQQRAQAESQLRHAQKMQSLGNLAGGLAHEMNNLLLPILALAKMTQKQVPEGSRDAKRLEKIVEASERAKALVAQVMAFGRQDEPKMESIDIYAIIRETMELLYKTLLSTITVHKSLDEATGSVWADAAQIGAVVINLINNAQDSFDGKSGRVDVTLGPTDVDDGLANAVAGLRTGRYAKLTVADHGKGMDDETLRRIFDPFFTTKEVGTGKGLGMSMVYGIVKRHDGAINLASTPGVGTTVDIYLPLIVQQQPA